MKSMRNLSVDDDLNLNFRSDEEEEEDIVTRVYPKDYRARSESIQNQQRGYLGSAKTAIQTDENTKLDKISSSELEHITGSFMEAQKEEDEFVD